MITLDQIKQLDHKVRNAVDKISTLKSENSMLQEKLDNYQIRIEELEVLIDTFKEDQGEIENGIINALNQLDILEDNIVLSEEDVKVEDNPLEQEQHSSEIVQESDNETSVNSDLQKDNIDTSNKSEDSEEEAVSTDSSENTESELDIF